ncbi:unnamed protein product [Cochlearia groenlandica]
MATTDLTNKVLVSSLMLVVMIASINAQADIKAICMKARNPSFCTNFMKSNPTATSANIPTLAKITFAAAQASATTSLTKIQALAKTETNPSLKKSYTSCVEQFGNAISNLNEGKQNLASGDGAGLNIKVSAAMEDSTTCQDGLASVKADPTVVTNSGDFQNICGIVLVISNMMGGRT